MKTELEFKEYRRTEEYSNKMKVFIEEIKKNHLENFKLFIEEYPDNIRNMMVFDVLLGLGRNWMQDNIKFVESLVDFASGLKLTYCYVEEYDKGRKARLREKSSGRHVSLGTTTKFEKNEFLKFLSQIKRYAMSVGLSKTTIFDRYKKYDNVIVIGRAVEDNYEKVEYIYDEYLTYFCTSL